MERDYRAGQELSGLLRSFLCAVCLLWAMLGPYRGDGAQERQHSLVSQWGA